MDTTTSILSALVLSSIGMGYCLYGRRQRHKIAFWTGVLLMILPYFFDSLLPLIASALLVMAAPKYTKNLF